MRRDDAKRPVLLAVGEALVALDPAQRVDLGVSLEPFHERRARLIDAPQLDDALGRHAGEAARRRRLDHQLTLERRDRGAPARVGADRNRQPMPAGVTSGCYPHWRCITASSTIIASEAKFVGWRKGARLRAVPTPMCTTRLTLPPELHVSIENKTRTSKSQTRKNTLLGQTSSRGTPCLRVIPDFASLIRASVFFSHIINDIARDRDKARQRRRAGALTRPSRKKFRWCRDVLVLAGKY
jgi:hypothetical protein